MNLTLDLEWSKKLKAAGIEGESEFVTFLIWGKWVIETRKVFEKCVMDGMEYYNAYSLEELLDMVEGNWGLLCHRGIYRCTCFRNNAFTPFANADPKIAVVEAILWQKGEGR